MKNKKLNILVLLREAIDPRPPVRLTADGFGIRERGLRRISNPADLVALQQALDLAKACGGEVTAVAVGPERIDDHMRLALSLGVGRAIRVWNSNFHGSDVAAEAQVLARIIEILTPDLIFTGNRMLDRGDDPILALAAAKRGISCISSVAALKCKEQGFEVLRKSDRGAHQKVMTVAPCAMLFDGESCAVHFPSQQALMQSAEAKIEKWGLAELGLSVTEIGAVAALLGREACMFPRTNPTRLDTPDANLPAFERILALLSGGIKPRAGKLHNLSKEQTVDKLMEIFAAEGLLGENS